MRFSSDWTSAAILQQTVTSLETTGTISPLLPADLTISTPDQQGDFVATDAIELGDGFSTLDNGHFRRP